MSIFFPSGDEYKPGERFLRLMALLLIFVLVVWAFWKNNERALREIESRQALSDVAHTLDPERKEFIRGFAASLRQHYGMEFRLQVAEGEIVVPELDSKTLFIGLSPESETWVVEVPPLLRPALGPEYIDYLKNEHFGSYLSQGNWQSGLEIALAAIWDKLTALHEEAEVGEEGAGG